MVAFLIWLHHNITAGLRGDTTVWVEDGRLHVISNPNSSASPA